MKLCIPSIGDSFRLTEDWTFPCFQEYRNIEFIKKMRPGTIPEDHNRWTMTDRSRQSVAITIPKGSLLTVQRIYIRSGKKEWDSITFTLKEVPRDLPPEPEPATAGRRRKKSAVATAPKTTKKATGRFWAKLRDVNEIECEPVEK